MKSTTRRLVTRHDEKGKARFAQDSELQPVEVATGDALFSLVWTTATVPADNMDETDGALREAGTTLKGGSVLRVVDFKPGTHSPMHRSHSIDYGIVLEGELSIELDSGEVKPISKGDIVIQRGTNHRWIAHPERWARMAFILIEAPPVLVDGQALEEQADGVKH